MASHFTWQLGSLEAGRRLCNLFACNYHLVTDYWILDSASI